jgi:hypothetical protein
MNTRQEPPLVVWAFAAAIAVSSLWVAQVDAPPAVDRLNLQRLRAAPSEDVQVVLLGSSKTRCALRFDPDFITRIDGAERRVVVHRVSWGAANFADLEPALKVLAEHPPAVLLVESDLLLVNRNAGNGRAAGDMPWRQRVQQNLAQWRVAIGAAAPTRGQNWGEDSCAEFVQGAERNSAASRERYAEFARSWRPAEALQRDAYLAYLRPLQQAGTRVVLLDLPRAASVDDLVPALLDRRAAELRTGLLAAGFPAWTPGPLGEALYADEAHLNDAGRTFYSAWLLQRIDAALRQPDA